MKTIMNGGRRWALAALVFVGALTACGGGGDAYPQSLRIADRAYVLEKGRVVLAGTGQEMLVNPFVRQAFLGL